ncbi:MAG: cysteine hydrolase [Alphaproteobacteria bacterium]|nr:cysteine hydrolase [Alphaproteobacteria bacterium]
MAQATDDMMQGWAAWKHFVTLPTFPVKASSTALVIIDMTYQQAARHYGVCKRLIDEGYGNELGYYLDRIETVVVPNLKRLIAACRQVGTPIFWTRCASLRGDGADQTWRHRSFGLATSVDSKDAQILEEIAPGRNDVLLTKTGSSFFNSTPAEHYFRNMKIDTLVITGIFTNSCCEGACRDAGDRDFRVLLAEDANAAMSPVGHKKAIDYLDGNFCHVRSTDRVIELLKGAPGNC